MDVQGETMSRQASAFLPFEPRLEGVYRRDSFDNVPLLAPLLYRTLGQLSLGEKKRAALAGLIVLCPALLLLDEHFLRALS
jgi:ATPase subunit of ABC transporter with duplicated ATPase domains